MLIVLPPFFLYGLWQIVTLCPSTGGGSTSISGKNTTMIWTTSIVPSSLKQI